MVAQGHSLFQTDTSVAMGIADAEAVAFVRLDRAGSPGGLDFVGVSEGSECGRIA